VTSALNLLVVLTGRLLDRCLQVLIVPLYVVEVVDSYQGVHFGIFDVLARVVVATKLVGATGASRVDHRRLLLAPWVPLLQHVEGFTILSALQLFYAKDFSHEASRRRAILSC
jgi:hypothetical protein